MPTGIKGEGAMRYRVVRTLTAGASLVIAGATLGCGVLGGGNTDAVCADAKDSFQQYITQVRGSSAADPTPWKQATERLAGRVDALAAKADEKALKKTLKEEAGRLRSAAAGVGGGDTSQLSGVMKDTPARLGKVCS
jgi:hypothetical protein